MADGKPNSGLTTVITSVVTAIIASLCTVAVAIATGWFSYASKDEELRVHLVEIALGILRAKPEEDVANARGWAVDVMERNSGVKFKEEDRDQLLHKPIRTSSFSSDFNTDFSGRGAITGETLRRLECHRRGPQEESGPDQPRRGRTIGPEAPTIIPLRGYSTLRTESWIQYVLLYVLLFPFSRS